MERKKRIAGFMQQFSIKDLEHFSGVKAHTIRIWEQRYQLLVPKRTATNIRYYSGEDLKKLLNVAMLISNGHKISKIAQMTGRQIIDAVQRVQKEGGTHEAYLNMLKISMINYDEALFHNVTKAYTEAHGFQRTVQELYLPFLSQVGVLWLTDAICPANEHFISHLFRQQLYGRLDTLPESSAGQTDPLFVHYLPEQEIHDISLLFFHYLARVQGHRSIFLGASVPFEDLEAIAEQFPQVKFVAYCTTHPSTKEVGAYLNKIDRHFGGSSHHFYLGGRVFEGSTGNENAHVYSGGIELYHALYAEEEQVDADLN